MSLREFPTDPHFATFTHKLLDRFYVPSVTKSTACDLGRYGTDYSKRELHATLESLEWQTSTC